jgi:hypothetical protein
LKTGEKHSERLSIHEAAAKNAPLHVNNNPYSIWGIIPGLLHHFRQCGIIAARTKIQKSKITNKKYR